MDAELHRNPAFTLDGAEAVRPIAHPAREHDTDDAWTQRPRRRAEERVDCLAETVFLRSLGALDAMVRHEHVVIGRRDVHSSALGFVGVFGNDREGRSCVRARTSITSRVGTTGSNGMQVLLHAGAGVSVCAPAAMSRVKPRGFRARDRNGD